MITQSFRAGKRTTMKLSQFLILLVLAVAIAIVVGTTGDAGEYVNFEKARAEAAEGNNESFHVVGTMVKDANGHAADFVYDPKVDPNYFSFKLIDDKGKTAKVIYLNPKPQDIERSEKVVVIGKAQADGEFLAEKILLKCPSKYQEGNVETASN